MSLLEHLRVIKLMARGLMMNLRTSVERTLKNCFTHLKNKSILMFYGITVWPTILNESPFWLKDTFAVKAFAVYGSLICRTLCQGQIDFCKIFFLEF